MPRSPTTTWQPRSPPMSRLSSGRPANVYHYVIGVDLAEVVDYTTLVVVEQQLWAGPEADWNGMGVFFKDGPQQPNGWISPAVLAPLHAERVLVENLDHPPPSSPPL